MNIRRRLLAHEVKFEAQLRNRYCSKNTSKKRFT